MMLYAMSEPEQLVVWTGARDMAIESGYAHRGMQEHIRRLVKAGHITRITRPDPRKRAHFSGFRLTMGLDGLPDGAQSDELET